MRPRCRADRRLDEWKAQHCREMDAAATASIVPIHTHPRTDSYAERRGFTDYPDRERSERIAGRDLMPLRTSHSTVVRQSQFDDKRHEALSGTGPDGAIAMFSRKD